MESRERILIAMDGGRPDRIPCALGFYYMDLGAMTPPRFNLHEFIDIAFARFRPSPEEIKFSRVAQPHSSNTRLGNPAQMATYTHWLYRPESRTGVNPLEGANSLADLRNFPFPSLDEPYEAQGLSAQVEAIHQQGLAAGGNLPHLGGELFEAAWRLRGLQNFLFDLLERPDWAHFLLDKLTALAIRNAQSLARSGIDVLALDDDVGMPDTMIIGPDTWRTFFKDRMARIIQAAREIKPDLRILYHSDGHFEPILEELIEIGVHAINPLQPEHMDAARIRRRFGPSLALWGTVGRQTAFSFNAPGEIRGEVRQRIETLGPDGLIICPAYDVDEPDIPWENVEAFLIAVRDYGRV
jgi:uroporphyrinogen decarboxylase